MNRREDEQTTKIKRRRGRPRKYENEPVKTAPCPENPEERLVKCPHCGAARRGQWANYSGAHGLTWRQCRACGGVYVFSRDGKVMRRVR